MYEDYPFKFSANKNKTNNIRIESGAEGTRNLMS